MSAQTDAPSVSMNQTGPKPQLDGMFFVDMNNVIFQVENTLFQVSRYPFVKGSTIFATMFSLPRNAELSNEGCTTSNPITLPGVTVADFRAFLQIVHPLECPFELPSFGVQEWAAVLRLSRLWVFDAVTPMATSKLEALLKTDRYPFEAILLGREFRRADWLLNGYKILIKRNDTITDEEAIRIGWSAAATVLRAREYSGPLMSIPKSACRQLTCDNMSCRRNLTVPSTRCDSCGDRDTFTLFAKAYPPNSVKRWAHKSVEDIFADEVAGMTWSPST